MGLVSPPYGMLQVSVTVFTVLNSNCLRYVSRRYVYMLSIHHSQYQNHDSRMSMSVGDGRLRVQTRCRWSVPQVDSCREISSCRTVDREVFDGTNAFLRKRIGERRDTTGGFAPKLRACQSRGVRPPHFECITWVYFCYEISYSSCILLGLMPNFDMLAIKFIYFSMIWTAP